MRARAGTRAIVRSRRKRRPDSVCPGRAGSARHGTSATSSGGAHGERRRTSTSFSRPERIFSSPASDSSFRNIAIREWSGISSRGGSVMWLAGSSCHVFGRLGCPSISWCGRAGMRTKPATGISRRSSLRLQRHYAQILPSGVDPILSARDFPFHAAVVPLRSHVLPVRSGSDRAPWRAAGWMARGAQDRALPPLRRKGARSRPRRAGRRDSGRSAARRTCR
jgi:hypothetical protein